MPHINRNFNHNKPIPYEHKDSDAPKYYNSKYWKSLRNSFIAQHPLCQLCSINGRSVPAEHVHHKRFFMSGKDDNERWNLLLDPDNLMSLCTSCHNKIHAYAKQKNISECDHY